MKVLGLLDRETGRVKTFVLDNMQIGTIVNANVTREARLMTDEAYHYVKIGESFAAHGVRHKGDEYVSSTDPTVHSNTIEGVFSIFKRGMKGVYQHCSKQHLHRYLAEFDFRYSNRAPLGVDDTARAVTALEGVVGKRLTYGRPDLGSAIGAQA